VKLWIEELLKYNGAVEMLKTFQSLTIPKFPVSGHALVEKKIPGSLFRILKLENWMC